MISGVGALKYHLAMLQIKEQVRPLWEGGGKMSSQFNG